ncbi:MAG: hypothetical protein WC070_04130 [Candidatus Magasanikbacteria bacterium]
MIEVNFKEKTKFFYIFTNWKKNFYTFFLLIFFVATGFFYYQFDQERIHYLSLAFPRLQESVAIVKEEVVDLNLEIGGDVYFEEEKIILPKLSSSSTPLSASEFTASNILVKDRKSGMILYGKNTYEEHALASITKLMSALILSELNLNLEATTTVALDEVSGNHIYGGDTITIADLWNISLVASSNKAILSLVDASGLSREEFVNLMNKKALNLGMVDTFFVEPTGLDARNISTASDVAILLKEALSKEEISRALNMKEVKFFSKERNKSIQAWNTNWLLLGWVPNSLKINGGKTGYIESSLYNFTVSVENEDGNIIDVVILGAKEHEKRFTEAKRIAQWALDNYLWE